MKNSSQFNLLHFVAGVETSKQFSVNSYECSAMAGSLKHWFITVCSLHLDSLQLMQVKSKCAVLMHDIFIFFHCDVQFGIRIKSFQENSRFWNRSKRIIFALNLNPVSHLWNIFCSGSGDIKSKVQWLFSKTIERPEELV